MCRMLDVSRHVFKVYTNAPCAIVYALGGVPPSVFGAPPHPPPLARAPSSYPIVLGVLPDLRECLAFSRTRLKCALFL